MARKSQGIHDFVYTHSVYVSLNFQQILAIFDPIKEATRTLHFLPVCMGLCSLGSKCFVLTN